VVVGETRQPRRQRAGHHRSGRLAALEFTRAARPRTRHHRPAPPRDPATAHHLDRRRSAIAQHIGDQARQLGEQAAQADTAGQASQLKAQADQLADSARQMADAVGSSFSDAVAYTSLVGVVILAVGTVLVGMLLPRDKHTSESTVEHSEDAEAEVEAGAETEVSSAAH
jgi:hypothetical protein